MLQYVGAQEVLSILDIKLKPHFTLYIHPQLQTVLIRAWEQRVWYQVSPTSLCDHRQHRRGKTRAIWPQQSWWTFFLPMVIKTEDKDASLWPWRPVGWTVCHREVSVSPTGANLWRICYPPSPNPLRCSHSAWRFYAWGLLPQQHTQTHTQATHTDGSPDALILFLLTPKSGGISATLVHAAWMYRLKDI